MSFKDRFADRIASLEKGLNKANTNSEVARVQANFDTSTSFKYMKSDDIANGLKTLTNTITDVVDNLNTSIPAETKEQLGIVELDESASAKMKRELEAGIKVAVAAFGVAEEMAQDGVLDVTIAAPFPEAIGAALKETIPTTTNDEVKTLMKNNVDTFNNDAESVDQLAGNIYGSQNSADSKANVVVNKIKTNTLEFSKNVDFGFGSFLENLVEEVKGPTQAAFAKAQASNPVHKNIPKKDFKEIVGFSQNNRFDKAADILKRFSGDNKKDLTNILKGINNKGSKHISDGTVSLDIDVERLDTIANKWKEAATKIEKDMFNAIIGNEITSELINLEREVTEVIVQFIPGKDATIEDLHTLYQEEYDIGFNPHYFIASDGKVYRGRPLEKEIKKTRIITNEHFKRSILIGVSVDPDTTIHKITPFQTLSLAIVLRQIIEALPGIQIFSDQDVGWEYYETNNALDLRSFVKSNFGKTNLKNYDPKKQPPLFRKDIAIIDEYEVIT